MTWNYRVLRTTHKNSLHEEESFYDIHEVYYDHTGKKIRAWSSTPSSVGGDTIEELHAELDRMRRALDKPILMRNPDGTNTLVEIS